MFNRSRYDGRFFRVMAGMLLVGSLFSGSVQAADDTAQDQIDFPNGLFQRGFYKEAVDEYKAYLAKFPKGQFIKTALYRMGEAAYAAQDYPAALEALDRYLGQETEPAARQRAVQSRGEVLYFLKRTADAQSAISPLNTKETPPEIRSRTLYFLGKIALDTGNLPEAVNCFKTLGDAIPDGPLAPYAHYQLACVYLAKNELENAAGEFSALATNTKTDAALRAEARFRSGEAYDKIGWYAQAISAFDQLLKEFPDSPFARQAESGRAWAFYHAGKFPEAAAATETLLKKMPQDAPEVPGMQYLRGNCLQQQQQYDAALALYAKIRAEHPTSEFAGRAQYKIAWCLYLTGKLDDAKRDISAFLQQPSDPKLVGDAAFLLGTILAAQNQYESAYEEFRLVAEKYAGAEFGAEALYKSGECLALLNKTEEAAKVFETFAQQYPDNILAEQALLRAGDAKLLSSSFDAAVEKYKKLLEAPGDATVEQEAFYRLAVTYHNMKKYEDSVKTFRALIEKYPANIHAAETQFRIGDYLLREGKDPIKSIDAYNAAVSADPKGAFAGRALKGIALARYETKDFDAASDTFFRVITEYPAEGLTEETYTWLGQRLYDQKKWDQAITVFNALLKAKPDYANPERIRMKMAECTEASGKNPEAIELYKAVVATAPQSTTAIDARYHMAQLYEKQNNPAEAVHLYEEAANTNTGEQAARARFRLGEIYEAKGDHAAAAKSYMCVVILFLFEQLSPEALWRAGQCFEKAGSNDQARKAYEELVKDYGTCEQATKAKEALVKLGG